MLEIGGARLSSVWALHLLDLHGFLPLRGLDDLFHCGRTTSLPLWDQDDLLAIAGIQVISSRFGFWMTLSSHNGILMTLSRYWWLFRHFV